MKNPNRPLRRPSQKSNFFAKVLKSNGLNLIIIIILSAVLIFYISKKMKEKPDIVDESKIVEKVPRPTTKKKPKASKVRSRRKRIVPRRTSTKEEKMNMKDEEWTPEELAEHTKTLLRYSNIQITGGELTLKHEKDPKKRAEIKRRVEGAKRFKKKLETIDPMDESTWFFKNDKKFKDDESKRMLSPTNKELQ